MKTNKLIMRILFILIIGIILVTPQPVYSSQLAHLAKRDLGVKEGSSRANRVAQLSGLRSSVGRSNAWCASIQSDWIIKSGIKITRTPSVHQLNKALSRRYKYGSKPKVGAVVIYKHSHTGTVVEILNNGYFVAIEGNHNNKVDKVKRHISNVRRFYYLES